MGANGDGPDLARKFGERASGLTIARIPPADGTVRTTAGEKPSIGKKVIERISSECAVKVKRGRKSPRRSGDSGGGV